MVTDISFSEVELLEKSSYDFGVLFGDVGGFSDVGLEVVEGEFFEVRAVVRGDVGLPEFSFLSFVECGVREVEFPVAFSDGSQGLVLIEKEGAFEFGLSAVEDFGDVEAVDHAVVGGFRSSEFCNGGHEVDGGGDEVVGCPGGDFARSTDDEGDAEAAFVSARFGAAERFAFSGVRRFSPPGAVVAGENDVGVFVEAEFLDFVEKTTGVEIEFLDYRSVKTRL